MGHPFADGEPVYDVTFENVQAGLRTDYLFRLANQHGGFVIGTGDLVGTGAGLVHLWRGRPDEPLRGQFRRAQDADPVSDPLDHPHQPVRSGSRCGAGARCWPPRSAPNWSPPVRMGRSRAPRSMIGPYELNDFFLHHVMRCGPAAEPGRLPGVARLERCGSGRMAARISRKRRRTPYDLPTIRGWLEKFLRRFFEFSQFKRSALPNGPKVSSGGALSPRGDWRAPSDAVATVWLNGIAR